MICLTYRQSAEIHTKVNLSTFDVTPITFPDTIQKQDFAEMRGKHLSFRTLIRFLKTDILFAQICTKYSLTVDTAVLFPSESVVEHRGRWDNGCEEQIVHTLNQDRLITNE